MWSIETDSDAGVFVIRSQAFLFPEHGWHDDIAARLAELGNALATALDNNSAFAAHAAACRVCFRGARHSLALSASSPQLVHLQYSDGPTQGLLYQERVPVAMMQAELTRQIDAALNRMIQRREYHAIADLSSARARIASLD